MIWPGIGRCRIIALLAVCLLGATGAGSAEAKRKARPDTLVLKVRWAVIPVPPESELREINGRRFFGKLRAQRRACRRGRQLFARYEYPPFNGRAQVRKLWSSETEQNVRTDGRGRWRAFPISLPYTVRVTAFVKGERRGRVCRRVESRPLLLRGRN